MAILAYGVATEGIIYPIGKDHGELDFESTLQIWSILWRPYIHLFGELDLDTLNDQLGSWLKYSASFMLVGQQIKRTTNIRNLKSSYLHTS